MPSGAVEYIDRIIRGRRSVELLRFQEVGSYAELLAGQQPSVLWLHQPNSLPPNDQLLFDELASDEVRENHFFASSPQAGIGLMCAPNLVVSGSSVVGTSSVIYKRGSLAPLYVDSELDENQRRIHETIGDLDLSWKLKRFLPGLSVLLTHWNSDVYGHWLMENMPTLLLLRRVAKQLPAFRIVLPRSTQRWVTRWIRLVLPDVVIEYCRSWEFLECERLLLITPIMDGEHLFHPELTSLLDELRSLVSITAPSKANCGEKIYVSRLKQSLFRELSNREEIEAIAIDAGLTVVRPESLSIPDQIALFSRADLIVGEFGSAMHNALFCPPTAKVFCLNMINGLQSRIAQINRHRVGYLLPSDGVPVTWVQGAPLRSYHIDPQVFRNCLRELLAQDSEASAVPAELAEV